MNAIEITNLTKTYKLYDRNVVDRFKDTFLPGKKKRHMEFHALEAINLTLKKGEILGIVGRNGAGKSTLLKIIAGITQPTSGSVNVNGRVVALLELGAGFNPEYTGKDNIYFTCALQGMTREDVDAVYEDIVDFAELGEFIDVPVKKYSSGMRARLGFATSINIDPDILILDEVLSVGDELFKRKCFVRIKDLFDSGKTVVYVSHSLSSVIQLCTRAILIHKGELLITGIPELVVSQYHRLLSNGSGGEQKQIELIKNFSDNDELMTKREENIKGRNLEKRVADVKKTSKDISNKAHFVEGFESKSRQIVKKKDVDILDYSLTTAEGKVVNHLVWGERYSLVFTASFNEDVENVRLGAIIYNEKSIDISGCIKPSSLQSVAMVKKGDKQKFEAEFAAFLNNGLYAVRFVVRAFGDNGELPVSLVSDAIVFRCSGEKTEAGLVNLFHSGVLV